MGISSAPVAVRSAPSALETLADRYEALYPLLTEFQRRAFLGAEAQALGSSGVGLVAEVAGVSATTVRKGRDELTDGRRPGATGRSRKPGG